MANFINQGKMLWGQSKGTDCSTENELTLASIGMVYLGDINNIPPEANP